MAVTEALSNSIVPAVAELLLIRIGTVVEIALNTVSYFVQVLEVTPPIAKFPDVSKNANDSLPLDPDFTYMVAR